MDFLSIRIGGKNCRRFGTFYQIKHNIAIFKLETLLREIDNLQDNKPIGVDKTSPIILKRYKAALYRPLLIIFQKSYSEGIVPYQWKFTSN